MTQMITVTASGNELQHLLNLYEKLIEQ